MAILALSSGMAVDFCFELGLLEEDGVVFFRCDPSMKLSATDLRYQHFLKAVTSFNLLMSKPSTILAISTTTARIDKTT